MHELINVSKVYSCLISFVFLSVGSYLIYLNMTFTSSDLNWICLINEDNVVKNIKQFDYKINNITNSLMCTQICPCDS